MSYGRRCEDRWMDERAREKIGPENKASVWVSPEVLSRVLVLVNTFDKGAIKEYTEREL